MYADLKATFALSTQPVVRAVKKVVDAYATLKTNLRAGNLGPPTSKRYRFGVTLCTDRCCAVVTAVGTVTVDGRRQAH
jgi:hypothetical protein